MEITAIIRSIRPESKIICGGPHVTLVHTVLKKENRENISGRARNAMEALENTFDVLVSGDGEKAIFAALEPGAPTLIDANERLSTYFMSTDEYNRSPHPSRHLIDLESYRYTIDNVPATSLIAQLGCPFSCGFCGGRESPCLRIVRTRTIDNITGEIEMLYREYGYTGFMFYDDELNVNPHLIELMEALVVLQEKLGVSFRLRGFVKAELFTDKQAAAMYHAGFRWILSGFESGSSRILENIKKRATREDNRKCIDIAHGHGMKVKALMSIGHPGESVETIDATRKWLMKTRPDDLDVTIITPYPGTAYYDRAQPVLDHNDVWVYTVPENGDRLFSYDIDYGTTAIYYKGDPNDGYRAYTYTDFLTSDQIVQFRRELDNEIRSVLKIPFIQSRSSLQYEHSMGQHPELHSRNSESIQSKTVLV